MNKLTPPNIAYLAHQASLEPIYHNPNFPPSLYYRFLKLLAEYKKPKLSVELGLCGGGGSLHLAQPGYGLVVGIDIAEEYPDNIKYLQANYQNFIFVRGDSVRLAPTIHHNYGQIDILFIDTTHTYDQTMEEYEAYKPYLAAGAVVCLDDLYREGMDRAWAAMPDPKIRLDGLHVGGSATDGGFGVVLL